jgi:hypothetical protein
MMKLCRRWGTQVLYLTKGKLLGGAGGGFLLAAEGV